jgi:dephospho-CoA kinase
VERPPRIGITGGIGSGKSTAVAMFGELGAAVIDTDAIARELTAPGGDAVGEIRLAFGAQVLAADGTLDRAALRARVFSDPRARARLEAILHPLIRERCRERAQRAEATAPLLIFDIPLLVEAPAVGGGLDLDRVLVVDCPVEQQLARARARATMPEEHVRAAIASQATRAQRLDAADDVLVNAGSLTALRLRVGRLWANYLGGACAAHPV